MEKFKSLIGKQPIAYNFICQMNYIDCYVG